MQQSVDEFSSESEDGTVTDGGNLPVAPTDIATLPFESRASCSPERMRSRSTSLLLANEMGSLVIVVPDGTLVGADAGLVGGHEVELLLVVMLLVLLPVWVWWILLLVEDDEDKKISFWSGGYSYSSTQDQSTSEHSEEDADCSGTCCCLENKIKKN